MKIILIGPPGSGKGSQARLIQKNFSIPHISTGNIFRALMQEDTPLGRSVNEYMKQARLVPDALVMQVVGEYLKKEELKENFLFDGFPRTLNQAIELDKIVNIDFAILLETSLETVSERVLTRRICSCGEVYNTKTYEKDICENCGLPLKARKDDTLETIKARFLEYEALTKPVTLYYKKQGKLYCINAENDIEKVFNEIKRVLKK